MKQVLFKFLHGIFFIVCVDLVAAGLWSWAVIQTFGDNIPKAPVAVVLAGDLNNKTGKLGPETLRRLNHVLDLYREEKVSYILCVGGARPRFNVFGSESMRQFLIDEGVSEGSVFLEKKSFDTKTNWHMAFKTVTGHGWGRMIVVSSPFHLHRFRRIVKEEPKGYLNVVFSPYSLKYAYPSITYFGLWKQIHYEWLAHFSQLLPEKTYNKLIRHMRAQ